MSRQVITDEKPRSSEHLEHVNGKTDPDAVHDVEIAGAGRTLMHQTKEERSAQLKIDSVMIPLSVLLYVAAYLDRSNIGNARLQGLEKDTLDNSDTNYSIALSCFYITYILLNVPGTMLAKAIPPQKCIGIGAFIWSVSATAMAGTHSPAGVYVARLFIGVGEAFFGCSIALWLSYWYTAEQFSKRIGFYICGGSLAGAFGGLIAFGVQHITGSSLPQWRILFLIEGAPTILLSIIVYFFGPARPQTSKLLNETQRKVVLANFERDSRNEGDTGLDWRAVKRAATDWKVYVIAVGYTCMNLNLSSVGGFLPTIIKNLGYSNARAQLFTVPPYAVALVYTLMITYLSDRVQSRGIPLAATFIVGVVGWVILMTVDAHITTGGHLHARYFGCICIVIAGYAEIPLMMAWQNSNNPSQSQRAYAMGMLNCVGQAGSVVGTFVFPSKEGPQFVRGIGINLAFQSLGCIIALSMTTYYRATNRKRDEREGGRPAKGDAIDVLNDYDLAKGFRYVV